VTSLTKNVNPNFPISLYLNYKIFRIFTGFDQLSGSIGRQVLTRQSHWHNSGFAVSKGLNAAHRAKNIFGGDRPEVECPNLKWKVGRST